MTAEETVTCETALRDALEEVRQLREMFAIYLHETLPAGGHALVLPEGYSRRNWDVSIKTRPDGFREIRVMGD